jgi:hypothetical protein
MKMKLDPIQELDVAAKLLESKDFINSKNYS